MKRSMQWIMDYCSKTSVFSHISLTFSEGVIDSEAAQDFVNIPGMEEAIASDHHLKGLWVRKGEPQTSPQLWKIYFQELSLKCGTLIIH